MKALACASLLLFGALSVVAEPKVSGGGSDINFGWPTFFKPQLSILREAPEATSDASDARATEATEAEPEEAASQTEASNEEDLNQLIDYTIKGGLRGTLINLSSPSMEDIPEEAKEAVNEAIEEESSDIGEITEEGIRLRTSMVTKKITKLLGKYGAQISFYDGAQKVKILYYGNWCGKGGRSAPVDATDRCCLEQTKCYGRLVRQCPDVWTKPYNLMYGWSTVGTQPICVRSEAFCVNHVCNCDRIATVCLAESLKARSPSDDVMTDSSAGIRTEGLSDSSGTTEETPDDVTPWDQEGSSSS